jgi:hypothetical protein
MNECGLCMSGWYCFLDLYELHIYADVRDDQASYAAIESLL